MSDKIDFWEHVTGDGSFAVEVVGDFARLRAMELVNVKPGQLIVDAGCGTGRLAREFAKSGARVIAVDLSWGMIHVGRQLEWRQPFGIQYVLGNITDRNFGHYIAESGLVDAVVCSSVLMENMPEHLCWFFKGAANLLRHGGKLVVSVVPHLDLFEIACTGECAWLSYGTWDEVIDSNHTFETGLLGGPLRQVYRHGNTGKSYTTSVHLHSVLDLGNLAAQNFTSVEFEHITITADMLEECGYSRNDPTVGVRGYTIMTAKKLG